MAEKLRPSVRKTYGPFPTPRPLRQVITDGTGKVIFDSAAPGRGPAWIEKPPASAEKDNAAHDGVETKQEMINHV